MVNDGIMNDMSLTPSQIQGHAIISAIRGRKTWQEIDKVVEHCYSLRKISNEKAKQKSQSSYLRDLKHCGGTKTFHRHKGRAFDLRNKRTVCI